MQLLSSLISDYLETGQYEKQLSPDMIKAYRIDLRQFSDFAKGVLADKDTLDCYIKHLNQHFAPRSVKRKLESVRAFYHEMEISGELTENPFDNLHIRIHSPQQLPRIIPEQIVQTLLQSAYDATIYCDADGRGKEGIKSPDIKRRKGIPDQTRPNTAETGQTARK